MRDLSHLALLRDARLAIHATSAMPVWLWSVDAGRILWANPVGAAIFGSTTLSGIATPGFDGQDQLARLAIGLPRGGPARLERLRGLGARFGRPLLCSCSRIDIADIGPAVLVVALEPAGPALTLAERVRRLYDDSDRAYAALSPDGNLIHANADGLQRLGPARDKIDPATIGAETLDRIGTDAAAVVVALFPPTTRAPTAPLVSAPTELSELVAVKRPDTPETPGRIELPIPERRHPLRFIWQMDAEGRFTLGSDEFAEMIGPTTATALGQPWAELAAELALDPEGQVARAVATRDTWSGITVSWPVDGSAERLKVDLSGLPVYDRNRNFLGYRGFGVCRDIDRIAILAHLRRVGAINAPRPAEASRPEPARSREKSPDERPALSVVPGARNVVPFPSPAESKSLSPGERSAFRELARQLTARLKDQDAEGMASEQAASPAAVAPLPEPPEPEPADTQSNEHGLLDRLPIGILIHRYDHLLYANPAFLAWTGHDTLDALAEAGGLDSLFIENSETQEERGDGGKALTITTPRGDRKPVEGRLYSVPWNGETALMLMIANVAENRHNAGETAQQMADAYLQAVLDAASDGVLVVSGDGRIQSANRSAEALFGQSALVGRPLTDLFAPDSARLTRDWLSAGSALKEGRELMGRARDGSDIPLFVTMARITERTDTYCFVCHDITRWKKTESDLLAARQRAEQASEAKSGFIAKVSHEIRTPLNSIIGFSELMIEERFGPIGNERYRDYLKDIHSSGEHVASLVNDLLDLSKIEAGKVDLTFVSVNINELVQNCVATMQPQANRERIIIRTSLAPAVRPVVADARSVRQIVLNLLSNAIKFTGAGGQVIVSTAQSGAGEATLRVRDTGVGMNEKDLAIALEPFRQVATTTVSASGSGLGLPLTKALTEANGATFNISSKVNDGTLVEITFPATRVLAV